MVNIESAGRKENGSLYVKSGEHYLELQPATETVIRQYHGKSCDYRGRVQRTCCYEFEKAAEYEIAGLKVLSEAIDH